MKTNPSGFDPGHSLKSAASNVASAFALNESYDFEDDEQIQILQWTENHFANIPEIQFTASLSQFLPECLIRRGFLRKIITILKLGYNLRDRQSIVR